MNNHEKCYRNNTFGYNLARKWFNWQKLGKAEEWYIADKLVALAELIDSGAKGTFGYEVEYIK